ncbi:iron permease FTR1 [Hyphopichia burtonii NRRL Y-1933]|uniref:Iron permease FTR1 n=1 Tax=Hyphopichia burtonii NRRL Y-1933 TaxID=984485 RepID=A0A1E4RJN6_9ASCO|nr:iron permease FTR1 [Hyphopichia burtonii NRRL Y-1933]ODV67440.1 iron permease FTR1 [Hyphopichia burtonii NRRL Y-1933]
MKTFDDYFSVQVFLIVLRETLELAIIVSVLLAFIHQSFLTTKPAQRTAEEDEEPQEGQGLLNGGEDDYNKDEISQETRSVYNYLRIQIWVGGFLGLVCCLILGTIILTIFYVLGNDLWSVTEHYWEGTFSIIASIIISIMGIKILRVNKMQKKWQKKLTAIITNSNYINKAINSRKSSTSATLKERLSIWSEKYSMFILPFVTTLREGMEAIVFIGGIGINEDTSIWAIINSVVIAIIIGSIIGVFLYRSGNNLSLQWFLVISTGFLYLVAAGLFSKGVWNFELQRFIDLCDGFDVSETGHGPGSYDITNSVWHVNCCNGELQEDGAFWMIVTAVFGWTNSATYGSVISYLLYWVIISICFNALLFEDKRGYLPLIPIKWQKRRINKKIHCNFKLTSPEEDLIRESIDSMTPLNT